MNGCYPSRRGESIEGIQLTQDAMVDHLGGFGEIFIAIAILFFAFTSILANFSFSSVNIEYLFRRHAKKSGGRIQDRYHRHGFAGLCR